MLYVVFNFPMPFHVKEIKTVQYTLGIHEYMVPRRAPLMKTCKCLGSIEFSTVLRMLESFFP
jgi:hypothetical protein